MFFAPAVIIVLAATYLVYLCSTNYELRMRSDRADSRINVSSDIISVKIKSIASDVLYMASMSLASQVADQTASIEDMRSFLLFSREKEIYETIRYVDITGMEIMRVENNTGIPTLTPKDSLQFMGRTKCFTESHKLNNEDLYLSSFKLKHNSAGNSPRTPLISFCTPLINAHNERKGVLMVRVSAAPLLALFHDLSEEEGSHISLLDTNGYWLKGENEQDEWGGILAERKTTSFANRYPYEWGKIQQSQSGQLNSEHGLFTWRHIDISKGLKRLLRNNGNHIAQKWIIVSRIPAEEIGKNNLTQATSLAYFDGAFAVLLAIGCLLLSDQRLRQHEAQQMIQDQNMSYSRFVPKEFLSMMGRTSYRDLTLSHSEQKELTVLFSDIRSYTTLSESLPPREVLKLLNEYFSSVNTPIQKNDGFIDAFIGDALMALFPNTAEDAVHAVLGMRQALHQFNAQQRDKGEQVIHSGFGLHFGDVTMGTIGTPNRMQATVIGDTVNLAARIESATKAFKCDIIISDAVFTRLPDPTLFYIREIDTVRVKGKQEPVVLYEVFDNDQPDILKSKIASLGRFQTGVSQYKAGEFEQALENFRICAKICPEDGIPALYIKRCSTMMRINPGKDWKGITTL